MYIKTILHIAQALVSLLLIVLILFQGGGAGLSTSYSSYANYYSSKRGFDKVLFRLAIITSVLFSLISILVIAL